MRKFQQENPNNCRVKINYQDKSNPVKFEYVGDDKPFDIAFKFWRSFFILFFGIPTFFYLGIIEGYALYTDDLGLKIYLGILMTIAIMSILYIFPLLLGLLFSKTRLVKSMPYLWGMLKRKYYAKFEPKDIIDNKIELPLYCNVFIHYKLEGDFSDKIDRIEVIEHPFNKFVKKGFFKQQITLKRQEYLWKATFYFKEKPKDGSLSMIFH